MEMRETPDPKKLSLLERARAIPLGRRLPPGAELLVFNCSKRRQKTREARPLFADTESIWEPPRRGARQVFSNDAHHETASSPITAEK